MAPCPGGGVQARPPIGPQVLGFTLHTEKGNPKSNVIHTMGTEKHSSLTLPSKPYGPSLHEIYYISEGVKAK